MNVIYSKDTDLIDLSFVRYKQFLESLVVYK